MTGIVKSHLKYVLKHPDFELLGIEIAIAQTL